jgi:hypothetical protein
MVIRAPAGMMRPQKLVLRFPLRVAKLPEVAANGVCVFLDESILPGMVSG